MLGNSAFLGEQGIDAGVLAQRADELRQDGATAIFIGVDRRAAGIFAIADPVKETTPGSACCAQGRRHPGCDADRGQLDHGAGGGQAAGHR